jgi:hypothetical protein
MDTVFTLRAQSVMEQVKAAQKEYLKLQATGKAARETR